MKFRWPRGKYNGKRIVGFSVTFRIALWDLWKSEIHWKYGVNIVKIGPVLLNFEGRYE